MFVALFKAPFMNGLTVTLTGIATAIPLASVTVTVKILVVADAGVAEKTKLKSPLKVCGSCDARFGEVNVTGLVPVAIQVSIALAALRLTRE